MDSSVVSSDLVPMISGYLILMAALAAGLWLQHRAAARPRRDEGTQLPGSGGKKPGAIARRLPPGWPRFAGQVCSVAVGGYLLLMAVDVGYYYGIAQVTGSFLESAFTGGLLLTGISLPVFGIASWLELRGRAGGRPCGAPRHGKRPGRCSISGR